MSKSCKGDYYWFEDHVITCISILHTEYIHKYSSQRANKTLA